MPLIIPTIFTANANGFTSVVNKMQGNIQSLKSELLSSAKTAIFGGSLVAGFGLAIKSSMDFEDKMADISKTTGATGNVLKNIGDGILDYSKHTRTSINDLQDIAIAAGQMGIASSEVNKFTASADKFAVALGSDFQGGTMEATKAVGSLRLLFKDTRSLDVSEALTKTGSAINDLSAKGVGVANLTDFIARVGQLPDAIKPSITNVAALGGVLDKAGLQSEISARGLGDVLLTASQNLPVFAKYLHVTNRELSNMLDKNPTEFLSKFASTFKNMDGSKIGNVLNNLKIGDTGSIKVIGALASSTELLSKFQGISNNAFEKGTSLLSEFNTKNETTAARFDQMKNQVQILAIEIGAKLLPVISFLSTHFENIVFWGGLLIGAFTLWKTSLFLSSVALGVNNALLLESEGLLVGNIVAQKASLMMEKLMTAQIWLTNGSIQALNVSMLATPFGIFIASIALIGGAYLLWKSNIESIEEKNSRLSQGIINNADEELQHVKNVTDAFVKQGDAIEEATRKANIVAAMEVKTNIARIMADARENGFVNTDAVAKLAEERAKLDALMPQKQAMRQANEKLVTQRFSEDAAKQQPATHEEIMYHLAQKNNDNTLHIIVNDESKKITVIPANPTGVKITTTSTFQGSALKGMAAQ